MYFPFLDHKTVTVNWPGSNSNDEPATVYTTEYPCIVFYENTSSPGFFEGYKIYAEYNNSKGRLESKTIYGEWDGLSTFYEDVSNMVYLYKAGIPVKRVGRDDDGAATGTLHILRLPEDMGQ